MRFLQSITSTAIVFSLMVSLLTPTLSLHADDSVNRTATYLKSKPANPWTTMALVAAGESNIPTDHLKTVDTSSAVSIEAPMMAIAATGNDPRTFAQENLVAKLKSFHTQGQIGDPGLLNDDIFGIVALRAAVEPAGDLVIQVEKTFILGQQLADGSWGDTNTTAAAIQALIETGMGPSDEKITKPLTWLKGTQNNDGGFPYSWPINSFTGQPDPSDSSSSAWVAHAVRKAGEDPTSPSWEKNGKDVGDALLSLQQANGSIAHSVEFTTETSFTPISTAYAVIALIGKSLPVAKFTPAGNNQGGNAGETISFRIEGSQATICTGTIPLSQIPNALEIIPKASQQCGFTYEIVQSSFGPYLKTIGNDSAQGMIGWLYHVNWTSPEIGAADFQLHTNDQVLWNYGDFAWAPLRLTIPQATYSSGASVSATLERFANGSWQSAAGTIHGAEQPINVDSTGSASFSLADGIWTLWAEAPQTIRSQRVNITVGSGSAQSIGLTVNVTPSNGVGGTSGGGTLSFVLEPSTLSFGNLAAGTSASRTFTIKNNGTVNAVLSSTVHGDALFVDNLLLDNASWRNFNASLAAAATRDVQTTLTIPSNSATGVKQGTLVFWAQAQ